MSVCCECCVLSGRCLCDELITRPEESYWLCFVVVCDLETSWMRGPWPTGGLSRPKKIEAFRYTTYCYLSTCVPRRSQDEGCGSLPSNLLETRGPRNQISVYNTVKRPYTLSVKLSDFTVWRHTWRKNCLNCAVLTGNRACLRTVLSSRFSHRELHSSLRESHRHLVQFFMQLFFTQLNCTV